LDGLRNFSAQTIEELGNKNPENQKIYRSYMEFMLGIRNWSTFSEKLYYQNISKTM
jgi:TRAP-type mannitol/chloroaromatic compound transport system substrate-binding protein